MSYNIDTVRYVSGKLFIDIKLARDLYRQLDKKRELAEDNFLVDLIDSDVEDGLVEIDRPAWNGEFSGSEYDVLKRLLERTEGEAQLLLVWEGGDRQTGLSVKNGVVKETKVKAVLDD